MKKSEVKRRVEKMDKILCQILGCENRIIFGGPCHGYFIEMCRDCYNALIDHIHSLPEHPEACKLQAGYRRAMSGFPSITGTNEDDAIESYINIEARMRNLIKFWVEDREEEMGK